MDKGKGINMKNRIIRFLHENERIISVIVIVLWVVMIIIMTSTDFGKG